MRIAAMGTLLGEAANGWIEHRALKLSAALAFYTTLALAPLTMISISIAGYFFGEEAARGGIVDQIGSLVGLDGAILIETLIRNASELRRGPFATVISVVILIFGATGVFAELKDSLDTIWEVERKPGQAFWTVVRTQLVAFAVVIVTGFLLLVSLLLTALLTAFAQWLSQWLSVTVLTAFLLDALVSLVVITILFALIYKLLPDVMVPWRDVWIGAVVTAMLFMAGKFLIGAYIGTANIGSIYGAAGSLVVILVWTYYSALVLFFGAELIRAYAQLHDREPIRPTEQAVPRSEGDSRKMP